jgi:hypothetical protein
MLSSFIDEWHIEYFCTQGSYNSMTSVGRAAELCIAPCSGSPSPVAASYIVHLCYMLDQVDLQGLCTIFLNSNDHEVCPPHSPLLITLPLWKETMISAVVLDIHMAYLIVFSSCQHTGIPAGPSLDAWCLCTKSIVPISQRPILPHPKQAQRLWRCGSQHIGLFFLPAHKNILLW